MVIVNAKQHIQRGAFHDYGFVVNRGLGAMKVLRWVGGLEKLQDGLQDLEKKYDNKRHTSSILVYKGSFGWLCGVIEYAEQHIQSREYPGHRFVVLGRGRYLKILRWVDGLVKKRGYIDIHGMDN